MIGKYCMVRSKNAGVFAGSLEALDGDVAKLSNARRIHYWNGAASLSQLATDGTSKPKDCRFPCRVDEVLLFGVIEIIPITQKAKEYIDSVPVWTR